jgi:fatty acid desaturase
MATAPLLSFRSPRSLEWPTLFVWLTIHSGWLALTFFHDRLPTAALVLGGGWIVAWHGSYQHEAIHGHPTRSTRLNAILASVPLSLWLPFAVYRRSHLAHHATHDLTAPHSDPEARYLTEAASPFRRALAQLTAPLAGRLLLGPFVEVGVFLAGEARLVWTGQQDRRAIWAVHGLLVAGLAAWLIAVCDMGLGRYLLCFVYPGVALGLIRSFAEHRAHEDPSRRIAIVENAPLLGLLFLNNNLHVAHHERPALAWHRLPAYHAEQRERLIAGNGGLVYDGYAEVFGRYLWRAHDDLNHAAALERAR